MAIKGVNVDPGDLREVFDNATRVLKTIHEADSLNTQQRLSKIQAIISSVMIANGTLEPGQFVDGNQVKALLTTLRHSKNDKDKESYSNYQATMRSKDQQAKYDERKANAMSKEDKALMNMSESAIAARQFLEKLRLARENNRAIDSGRNELQPELNEFMRLMAGNEPSADFADLAEAYPSGDKEYMDKLAEVLAAQQEYNKLNDLWNPTERLKAGIQLDPSETKGMSDEDIEALKEKKLSQALKDHYGSEEYMKAFPRDVPDPLDPNNPEKFSANPKALDDAKARLEALQGEQGNIEHALNERFWKENYPELASSAYKALPSGGKMLDFRKNSAGDITGELLQVFRNKDNLPELIYKLGHTAGSPVFWLRPDMSRPKDAANYSPRYVIHKAGVRRPEFDKAGHPITFKKSGKSAREFYVTDSSNDRNAPDFSGYAPGLSSVFNALGKTGTKGMKWVADDKNPNGGSWQVDRQALDFDTSDDFINNQLLQDLIMANPDPKNPWLPIRTGTNESDNMSAMNSLSDYVVRHPSLTAVMKRFGMSEPVALKKLNDAGYTVRIGDDSGAILPKTSVKASQRRPLPLPIDYDKLSEKMKKSNEAEKKFFNEHPELRIVYYEHVRGRSKGTTGGKTPGGGFQKLRAWGRRKDGTEFVVREGSSPENMHWTDEARKIAGWATSDEMKAKREAKAQKRAANWNRMINYGLVKPKEELNTPEVKNAKATEKVIEQYGAQQFDPAAVQKVKDVLKASDAQKVFSEMSPVALDALLADYSKEAEALSNAQNVLNYTPEPQTAETKPKDFSPSAEDADFVNKDTAPVLHKKDKSTDNMTPVNKNVVKVVKGED